MILGYWHFLDLLDWVSLCLGFSSVDQKAFWVSLGAPMAEMPCPAVVLEPAWPRVLPSAQEGMMHEWIWFISSLAISCCLLRCHKERKTPTSLMIFCHVSDPVARGVRRGEQITRKRETKILGERYMRKEKGHFCLSRSWRRWSRQPPI